MVFTEELFRKFLKTRAGIREGVPNTVLGFSSAGRPEATPKSSLGGGATEKIAEIITTSLVDNVNITFPTITLDGTQISKLTLEMGFAWQISSDRPFYTINNVNNATYNTIGYRMFGGVASVSNQNQTQIDTTLLGRDNNFNILTVAGSNIGNGEAKGYIQENMNDASSLCGWNLQESVPTISSIQVRSFGFGGTGEDFRIGSTFRLYKTT